MVTGNEIKYQKVLDALSELHSDTSVSLGEAISNMKGVRDHVDSYIDALEGDLARQEAAALEDGDG